MLPLPVAAAPQHGIIGHDSGGNSSIVYEAGVDGTQTRINQSGDALYIDWDSFNLASDETVSFHQPNATAVALNHILDANPTSIQGQIDANGRIFLINANGIVFADSAVVNVHGLLASTLTMSQEDFIEASRSGHYVFSDSGTQGTVINQGLLSTVNSGTGGSITLLGHDVDNRAAGLIVANRGQVNLVSAAAVTIDFAMDGLMQFAVDAATSDAAATSNAGIINANDGWIVMSAQSAGHIIANTVNNSGLLKATRIDSSHGAVHLIGGNGNIEVGQIDAGQLRVTAHGNITGGERIRVSDSTRLNSGGDQLITLDHSDNDFTRISIDSTGDTVRLRDSNAISLAGINAASLDLSAGGAIIDVGSGSVVISGLTQLAGVDNGLISLNNAGNDFNTISVTSDGARIVLNDRNTMTLGRITAANSLNISADGDINQSAAVSVKGNTILNSGGDHLIDLTHPDNDFARLTIDSLNDTVRLRDDNGISLGGMTSASLDIIANGNITDSGPLVIAGITTISNSAENAYIILNEPDNDFATINISSPKARIKLNDSNAIDLGTITAARTLSVTTAGDISQSGALDTMDTIRLDSGDHAYITLDNPANDFRAIAIVSRDDTVVLRDANSINLGTINMANSLDIRVTGYITQRGPVSVSGTTLLDTGGGQLISLQVPDNDFASVNVTSHNDTVLLADSNEISLAAITAASLTLTTGGDITQTGDFIINNHGAFSAIGADVKLIRPGNQFGSLSIDGHHATVSEADGSQLTAFNLSGDLHLTSGGNISQGGALRIGGHCRFDAAGGGFILLDHPDNDFASLSIDSISDTVQLRDSNAIELGAITTDRLRVTAGGDIGNSGALVVGGSARFHADNQAAIILNHGDNDFDSVTIGSSHNSIELADINAIELGPLDACALTVIAGGDIRQSGILNVSGDTRFDATGFNVWLNRYDNHFGRLALNAHQATVTTAAGNALGAITIATDFTLSGHGSISQSAAIRVSGTTELDSGGGQTISLTDAANDFTRLKLLSHDDVVTLTDSNAIELAQIDAAALTVTAAGDISQSGRFRIGNDASFNATNGDILLHNHNNYFGRLALTANRAQVREGDSSDLAGVRVTTDFTLSANGNIRQSGALVVGGHTSLDSGGNELILLGHSDNDFTSIAITSQGDTVVLNDSNGIDLAGINRASSLNISTDGTISDSAGVSVSHTTTLDSGNQAAIILDHPDNDFARIKINSSGDRVVLHDSGDLVLQGINAASLGITAGGSISDSGAIVVSGKTTLASARGAITLDHQDNDFARVAVNAIGRVVLNDRNSIVLQGIDAASLSLTTVGNISDTAALKVSGTTTLDSGDNALIMLNHPDNDFARVTINSTGDRVVLHDRSGIVLGGIAAASLSVIANGPVGDSAALVISGKTTVGSGNKGSIVLDHPDNDFARVIAINSGGKVVLNDRNAIVLQGINASRLSITADGNISDVGVLKVTGTTVLDTGGDAVISLNQQGNDFGRVIINSSADQVVINDSSWIDLGGMNAASLRLTSNGNISDSAALVISGKTSLDSGNRGSIILDHPDNDFARVVAINSSGEVVLNDRNAIVLQAVNADSLSITSNGNISDSGALKVTGTTTLNTGGDARITLDHQDNDFGRMIIDSRGDQVCLNDINTIDLGEMAVDRLKVTADSVTCSGTVMVNGEVWAGC